MKKTTSKNKTEVISQECLVEALRFLFCPTLEDEDSELRTLAKALVSRANKLDQDANRCRTFYKKLFKKNGVVKEVEVANFRTLAKRIL